MTKFKWLVSVTIILTMVVIIYGAFTRLTDAGLGCPDWPGCYGFLKVPQKPQNVALAAELFPERPLEPQKAWNEMIHRYLAGSLGLLIGAIFIASWVKRKKPQLFPAALLSLVIFQAALGAWTVTMGLLPIIVLAHLLGGFTIFCLLVVYWLELTPELRLQPKPQLQALKPLAIGATLVVLMQIALGGWTAANYAALACIELPFCEAGWTGRLAFAEAFDLHLGHDDYEFGVMSADARATIHVLHRIGALVTLSVLCLLLWRLYRVASSSLLRGLTMAIAVVLGIQFTLGVLNVVLHLPLANAVAHNFIGANLLMLLVVLLYLLYRPLSKEA
ncbi:COX15/CtaA family protein [Arsukibacterium sp.]|uniref:COX15/CtaA family protein n=1 Tax=Arsukibacterium sp. TaxID=1977258 RepID=UPI002FD8919D